eukprot:351344-Chlamydomonas_euryale.AAC.5
MLRGVVAAVGSSAAAACACFHAVVRACNVWGRVEIGMQHDVECWAGKGQSILALEAAEGCGHGTGLVWKGRRWTIDRLVVRGVTGGPIFRGAREARNRARRSRPGSFLTARLAALAEPGPGACERAGGDGAHGRWHLPAVAGRHTS